MSKEVRNYVEEAREMSLDDYLNLRKKLFKEDEDVSNHELYNTKYLKDSVSIFVLGMEAEESFFARAIEECSKKEAFSYIDWDAVRNDDRTPENVSKVNGVTAMLMYLYDMFLSISVLEKEKHIVEQIINSIEASEEAFKEYMDKVDKGEVKNLYTIFHEDIDEPEESYEI